MPVLLANVHTRFVRSAALELNFLALYASLIKITVQMYLFMPYISYIYIAT